VADRLTDRDVELDFDRDVAEPVGIVTACRRTRVDVVVAGSGEKTLWA
jgi:hypothetical protein